MSDSEHSRLLILGSGPAGCTAAIYAARAMMEPLMIAGIQPGGQLTITTEVENYPGFRETIQGPWLMEQMQAQAEHLGTRVAYDLIASADLARRQSGWGSQARNGSRALASRPAPPAMAFSSRGKRSQSSAAAIRRWRKR